MIELTCAKYVYYDHNGSQIYLDARMLQKGAFNHTLEFPPRIMRLASNTSLFLWQIRRTTFQLPDDDIANLLITLNSCTNTVLIASMYSLLHHESRMSIYVLIT